MRPASRWIAHVTLAGAMLFLAPLAEHSGAANTHSKFVGVYQSAAPPPQTPASTNKPTPTMSLDLGADGTATVTEDPGKGSRTLFGHWVDSGSQVTITFDATAGAPAEPPMVFQPSHDGLQAVTWNHAAWGAVNPPPMKKGNPNWHSGDHRRIF